MQATGAATKATSEQVAAELLAFWSHLMRDTARGMYERLEELDLGLTQMKVLHTLEGCREELSVKELAELMGISLPGASRCVDGLLRRGFVERREDDQDRRMKRLQITPAGREVAERLATARLAGIEQFTATLSDEQRTALAHALALMPHHDHPEDPA